MSVRIRLLLLAVASAVAFAAPAPAGEVTWTTVQRTYPVRYAQQRHGPTEPPKGGPTQVTVTNVVLKNRYIRIEVAPDLAGRVMHVTYADDGEELFNTVDWIMTWNVWDCGGWRASFPFYEHGMRFRGQTAGWRVLENPDGSMTLAMDMRFGRFMDVEDINYKGRFSHMRLGRAITLRPGQAYYECRLRVENPLPYRMGVRLWTTAQFPESKDAEFLFPCSRMGYHRLQWVKDWDPRGEASVWKNWKRQNSYFCLNLQQPFVGVYYPGKDENRLRIVDPKQAPGAKLWAWSMNEKGNGEPHFYEIWTGLDRVFEQAGHFLPPFETTGFTEREYLARGIGRAEFANEHVAVGLAHRKVGDKLQAVVKILPVHPAQGVRVQIAGGAFYSAKGMVDRTLDLEPLKPVEFSVPVPDANTPVFLTMYSQDGPMAFTQLPVAQPEKNEQQEQAIRDSIQVASGDLRRLAEHSELRGWIARSSRQPALGTYRLQTADALVKAEPDNAELHTLRGRLALRLGELAEAQKSLEKAAALDPANGEAHHLLGLVLSELGKTSDADKQFREAVAAGKPCAEALYFVAMGEIAAGNDARAAEALKQLAAQKPGAVRPRQVLVALLARLGRKEDARKLAAQLDAEDPASVETAYVYSLASPTRKKAFEKLLQKNPEAPEAVEQLKLEIGRGRWNHPRRPGPWRYVSPRSYIYRVW